MTKMLKYYSLILLVFLFSCTAEKSTKYSNPDKVFTEELAELQQYYSIPGLAAVVEMNDEVVFEKYFGFSDFESKVPVDSLTLFPIASITKAYSAVLLLKLVEQGFLSLNDPISKFIPESELNDSILVKHLLSHTSQGQIGQQFFYSYRFGYLTAVIESVSGKPFDQSMEELFEEINLDHTYLLKDSSQLFSNNLNVALPYMYEGDIQNGFIDYGYSTSAGIASTARDLLVFNQALDSDLIISQDSRNQMYQPFFDGSPYGYGIFTQNIEGLDIIWAYGQYDCYSSLLLKVPSKDLTLILLANNNLMSDPARLIMGDLTASLFAISFLKNYVFNYTDLQLLEDPESVYKTEFEDSEFYRRKVLAQALAESFMARFDPSRNDSSAMLIQKTLDQFPDYLEYANINLLHNLSFMKTVAFYMELGEFNQFDEQIEQIGSLLLEESPNNPYVHVYMGSYYDSKGDKEKARFHYESIVNAENFSPFWYTSEAQNWLIENQ